MRIGMHAVALGSQQQQKRLDVIANNLANTNTPGYKRDEVHFGDFIFQTTFTQFEQGPVRTTDNPMDIALSGEGFLRVQTAEGVLYTRGGNLTLSNDNTLVTQEGWPVLGKSGPIQVSGSEIRIDPSGQVFDGEEMVDTLDLVKFAPKTHLNKVRKGYVQPSEDQPLPAEACSVQQGALEGANFNVVEEMARMVDTLRVFEAYQKVLQTTVQDLDAQVISKLGSS